MDSLERFGFNFHNSYLSLPEKFYSKSNINTVKAPRLLILNESLANDLGLDLEMLKSSEGVNILSGNIKVEDGAYISQAYAGNQFGHFTMLGDGRAVLIGEQIAPDNKRFDIQLKGSGETLYSRGGDGRAALGPMLREYLISEAMYHLHVKTTRSLAVVTTGENVYRETPLKGAILTRVASSHIRFGTFQYAYKYGSVDDIKRLADYTIERHYQSVLNDENRYLGLLKEVISTYVHLIARWQSIGFIHGVMNTDNMTLSGETIDYGPCAFMNTYNPKTVFSSIDVNGRYSYENQPRIVVWNLCRFAETLIPILDEDDNIATELAQNAINEFNKLYEEAWLNEMRGKLGIIDKEENDKALILSLLDIMKEEKLDFTNTFLELTFHKTIKSIEGNKGFQEWLKEWKARLKRQNEDEEIILQWMKNNNPQVIPRNHKVEEALKEANNGDLTLFNKMLEIISNPYDHTKIYDEYKNVPEGIDNSYRTFCGT